MQDGKRWLLTWSPRRKLFVAVVAVVSVLDQWSKYWAVGHLTDAFMESRTFGARLWVFLWDAHPLRTGSISVNDVFWRFVYAENPGAAFSFLASAPAWLRAPFFQIVTLVALGFIIVYYRRTTPEQRMLRWALALVFGGAIGNFLDRVRLGYVIDFIQWHWYDRAHWPTFNVADVAISVGVALMVFEMVLAKQPGKGKAGAAV